MTRCHAATAHLLQPLPLLDGGTGEVRVQPLAPRHFHLDPWPFAQPALTFSFPARHVPGHRFTNSAEFAAAYESAAPSTSLSAK